MLRLLRIVLIAIFLQIFVLAQDDSDYTGTISQKDAEIIAYRVWQNECGGKVEYLTWWGSGELFPSFGIGHFIWFPPKVTIPFEQQFPEFLQFAKQEKAKLPPWLENLEFSPWATREAFLNDLNSPKMLELRVFLFKSFAVQARFIAQKLEHVLPKMLATLSEKEKEYVSKMFYNVFHSKNGVYALADYLNFKGSGCCPKERYANTGWGLLQVLQNMRDSTALSPVEEFVFSAKTMLLRRVQNSPQHNHEAKYLRGWCNRLDTYYD